ncbi:MAG: hypothetical protein K2N48_05785, partial [Muribaculaceae bacterium]|nr:hypothetical protein [Muribaculaceae bacterium]
PPHPPPPPPPQKTEPRAASGVINFDKSRCPKIDSFRPNEGITWKDWVTLISGNIDNSNFWTPGITNWQRGCFEANTSGIMPNLTSWAKTLGPYRGYKGRPISENKLLDTSFWYYENSEKYTRGGEYFSSIALPNQECIVTCMRYLNESWDSKAGWKNPNYGDWNRGRVEPGVYGAYIALGANDKARGYAVISYSVDEGKTYNPFIQCWARRSKEWEVVNSIFFSDVPIRFLCQYSKENTDWNYMRWNMIVFRITPPGYWHL